MYNETITYYAKNPVNKYELDDFDIEFYEENRTCWDELTVYIKFDNNTIKDWSFVWDTAIITTACASVFWESIIWKCIDEVLNLDYDYIEDLVWMPILPRRKQASVMWLLTTKNAIHSYLNDWKQETYKDLI